MTQSARTPVSLGTLRKARSQIEPGIWRGKAWNERAGQAFAIVECGVVDRATANSSPRTAAGHKHQGLLDRIARWDARLSSVGSSVLLLWLRTPIVHNRGI